MSVTAAVLVGLICAVVGGCLQELGAQYALQLL